MPAEPHDIQKQTDRDILVEVRAELRYVKESVAEMKADFRADIAEIKQEQRSMRVDIDDLRRNQDRAAGGLGLGKWVVGALASFPFLGGLVGYFVSERGGP